MATTNKGVPMKNPNAPTTTTTQNKIDLPIVSYKTSSGALVTLNEGIIKALTNNNTHITADEIMLFMETCRYQKINPLIKEAHLIKYDDSKPAQMVTSVNALERIAQEQPQYDGKKEGVVVLSKNGKIIDREGAILLPGETLLGGWCIVFRKDQKFPTIKKVNLKEYSKSQSTWTSMPCTMICKVARAQALRSAFAGIIGSLYTEEEMSIGQEPLPTDEDNTIYGFETEVQEILTTPTDYVVEDNEIQSVPTESGADDYGNDDLPPLPSVDEPINENQLLDNALNRVLLGGKNKGKKLSEMSDNYLQWCVDNSANEELKADCALILKSRGE